VSSFKEARRIAENQIRNFGKAMAGKPLVMPSLGSMTLDRDDVEIARAWLNDRSRWRDPAVTEQFTAEFARWNGSRHVFAFWGGRVALSACIYALGLAPGEEVILPGYTCVVVPNAFHYAGIRTVYVDIELDTYGLDVARVEENINPNTRAILLHHLYGLVCRDYEDILALARRHRLRVIEDCAQSTGAEYRGQKVGNMGDVGFYSCEQSKVLNTVMGGIAVTNDDSLGVRLKDYFDRAPLLREEWIDRQLHTLFLNYYRYKHPHRWLLEDWAQRRYGNKEIISTTPEEERGVRPAHYGCKMPAPVAAVGLNQMKKIDAYNERRRRAAQKWDHWCEENGYQKPLVLEGSVPVFLRYPVMVEPERKADLSWAEEPLHVTPGVWFISNIHPVPTRVDGCPNADRAVRECINFPCLLE
jgi:perosamine synthetase